MTFIILCPRCKGEGRRTDPPYDGRYPDRPMTWREDAPCHQCHGVAYLGGDHRVLREHIPPVG